MNKVEVDVDQSGKTITINEKEFHIPENWQPYIKVLSYGLMLLAGYVLGSI